MNKGRSVTVDRDDNFSTTRSYGNIPSGTQTMPSGEFRGHGMMGTLGTVTAISSDSITIKDTQRGGLVTFKIDASTKVTNGTDTKAVSDITTGTNARIQASTGDSLTAGTITIEG